MSSFFLLLVSFSLSFLPLIFLDLHALEESYACCHPKKAMRELSNMNGKKADWGFGRRRAHVTCCLCSVRCRHVNDPVHVNDPNRAKHKCGLLCIGVVLIYIGGGTDPTSRTSCSRLELGMEWCASCMQWSFVHMRMDLCRGESSYERIAKHFGFCIETVAI